MQTGSYEPYDGILRQLAFDILENTWYYKGFLILRSSYKGSTPKAKIN